jgi:hypothetical protein
MGGESGSLGTITTSGESITLANPEGALDLSLEIIPHGVSSLVVSVSGQMRGGTTTPNPIATSNTPSANILSVTASEPFDSFLVQAVFNPPTASVLINYKF